MPARIAKPKARSKVFIKEWREFRKLTQDDLAEELGSTKTSVSRLERGEQALTIDVLDELARILKTTRLAILSRAPGEDDDVHAAWERAKPADKRRIIEIYTTMKKR